MRIIVAVQETGCLWSVLFQASFQPLPRYSAKSNPCFQIDRSGQNENNNVFFFHLPKLTNTCKRLLCPGLLVGDNSFVIIFLSYWTAWFNLGPFLACSSRYPLWPIVTVDHKRTVLIGLHEHGRSMRKSPSPKNMHMLTCTCTTIAYSADGCVAARHCCSSADGAELFQVWAGGCGPTCSQTVCFVDISRGAVGVRRQPPAVDASQAADKH